jgi:hypothetical protein
MSSSDTNISVRAVPLSQLPPAQIDWLWLHRLAPGKPTLLIGDPGVGKSYLALDLCARPSTGRAWPDGSLNPGPANSLVLNAEDDNRDTLGPRLLGLGADLSRVFVLHRHETGLDQPLGLPSGASLLDALLEQSRARLLVLDPIVSFLDASTQVTSDQSVRRALEPLKALAEKYRCVPLLHCHMNKNAGHRVLYRALGSIGFTAACRSTWLLARDPQQPGVCVLAQAKNNLAPRQPSLGFQLQLGPSGMPALDWTGISALTAEQLLAADSGGNRASQFLRGFLAEGPRTSMEVWTASQDECLSKRALLRAKEDLGVRSRPGYRGEGRCWYWLLRGQELPPAALPPSDTPELDRFLAEQEQLYPSANPLDGGQGENDGAVGES